jgi:hypothetical protein
MLNFEKHLESEGHRNQYDALEPERERRRELSDRIHILIDEYEDLSAITCEACGKEGSLSSRGYWLKTVCTECAIELVYTIVEEEDEEDEE